ncbi:MAG: aminopeptidase [Clostridia bacterium]|nr:aminopeptidase [Clostridia bacterium]
MDEKIKEIKENLLKKKERKFEKLTAEESIQIDAYAKEYMRYLDEGKTEREAAARAMAMAADHGYVEFKEGSPLLPGSKYAVSFGGKMVVLVHMGELPMSEGCNIIASHIDSPRLDLKPNPLYEESNAAYFKTHYYGGIRKYQWMTIPLALHGVVCRKDGETVEVAIGEAEGDPVFCITDLLPHLGREQGSKPLNTAHAGEILTPIAGTIPYAGEGEDRVKLSVMALLNSRYGITEEDFASAELSFVPAVNAKNVGLDASLIGAYGQDDRVCAYASLAALLGQSAAPKHTSVVVLADKEEIGSEGVSGMKSAKFDHLLASLCGNDMGVFHACLDNSLCLSCDVSAAFDPSFAEVYERRNTAYINGGISICKYTGGGGKSGASDASAETLAKLRKAFAENDVTWQLCELGKIDVGGGGTVAKYMAERGIETIDAGTPVLSMHAPFEVTSKFDCYHTYLGCKAILAL